MVNRGLVWVCSWALPTPLRRIVLSPALSVASIAPVRSKRPEGDPARKGPGWKTPSSLTRAAPAPSVPLDPGWHFRSALKDIARSWAEGPSREMLAFRPGQG